MAGRHPMPLWQWLEAAPIQYDLATLMRADPPRRGFEKPGEAEAELAKRVELLSTSALPGAARLATKLRCDDGTGPVPSLANPVYCRAWRRVTGSGLMVCIRQARRARLEVRAFTIVLPHHTVPADHLHLFDPATVTTSMRRLLLKHLPPNPTGWLYLRVHGEYEGTSDTFVIHAHGLASGDYLTTLNGPVRRDLRKLRKLANDTGRIPHTPHIPHIPHIPHTPHTPQHPEGARGPAHRPSASGSQAGVLRPPVVVAKPAGGDDAEGVEAGSRQGAHPRAAPQPLPHLVGPAVDQQPAPSHGSGQRGLMMGATGYWARGPPLMRCGPLLTACGPCLTGEWQQHCIEISSPSAVARSCTNKWGMWGKWGAEDDKT
jgi:hypothetical protein